MALQRTIPICSVSNQLSSPFFKLPAELRVAIYELLDFLPIDHEQCRGLILSCRQAKSECDGIAAKTSKAWLAAFKESILAKLGFEIRLLLSLSKPIAPRFKLNTIRELTVVFPADMLQDIMMTSDRFWEDMRQLNPIFGLWLDKLTLHFQVVDAFLPASGLIVKGFRRLLYILHGGFTYAHDPVGQAREKETYKYSSKWDIWKPEPAFMRKIVVSWDVRALPNEESKMRGEILLEGIGRKCPTPECVRSRAYHTFTPAGLNGEMMKESECRFRPSVKERRFALPTSEHKEVCFKCGPVQWDYRRYMRALPEAEDDRWV